MAGWLMFLCGVCTLSSNRWGTRRFFEPWGGKQNAEESNDVQSVYGCWSQHVVLALRSLCLLCRVRYSAAAAAAMSSLWQRHQGYCPCLGFATHPVTRFHLAFSCRTARLSCWDLVNNLSIILMYITVMRKSQSRLGFRWRFEPFLQFDSRCKDSILKRCALICNLIWKFCYSIFKIVKCTTVAVTDCDDWPTCAYITLFLMLWKINEQNVTTLERRLNIWDLSLEDLRF